MTIAVSYTHLDVYKRQGNPSAVNVAIVNFNNGNKDIKKKLTSHVK